jgi:hypothetical protein
VSSATSTSCKPWISRCRIILGQTHFPRGISLCVERREFHPLAYRAAGSLKSFQAPYSNRSHEAAHASRIPINLNGDVVFVIEFVLMASPSMQIPRAGHGPFNNCCSMWPSMEMRQSNLGMVCSSEEPSSELQRRRCYIVRVCRHSVPKGLLWINLAQCRPRASPKHLEHHQSTRHLRIQVRCARFSPLCIIRF